MRWRPVADSLAAAALLAIARCAAASTPTVLPSTEVAEQPRYLADSAPETTQEAAPKPLMALLNACGIAQSLEKSDINIFGYVQGSYTHNFDSPRDKRNFGRIFDYEDKDALLNQVDLTIERTVDLAKKQFDVGGRIEWIFGADAGFLHSNGLFDWYDSPRDPENQFDLYQAYLEFAIPVGNGLLVRAGKFSSLSGHESTTPTESPFYSHGLLYNWVGPYTQTGVLGTYAINDAWAFTAGISRGWEQATEDNNGAIDFVGQAEWTVSEKTSVSFSMTTGPEATGNNEDYRTLLNVVVSHEFTDKLSMAFEGDFAWEADAADDGGTAYWYGLGGYPSYILNSYLTLNGRLEWFRDDGGSRIGVSGNYYEATIGVAISPLPNDRWGQYLVIRPELRADLADQDVFNDGSDQRMFTLGIDMIYSF